MCRLPSRRSLSWNQTLIKSPYRTICYWSDSEATFLDSISSIFVVNIRFEQEWSGHATWLHVRTKQNPADILFRGSVVHEIEQSIWFTWPLFVMDKEDIWPKNAHFQLNDEVLRHEARKTAVRMTTAVQTSNLSDVIEGFSSPSFDHVCPVLNARTDDTSDRESTRRWTPYSPICDMSRWFLWPFLYDIEYSRKACFFFCLFWVQGGPDLILFLGSLVDEHVRRKFIATKRRIEKQSDVIHGFASRSGLCLHSWHVYKS